MGFLSRNFDEFGSGGKYFCRNWFKIWLCSVCAWVTGMCTSISGQDYKKPCDLHVIKSLKMHQQIADKIRKD